MRDIRDCHEELICAAASPRYCLLATGGEDGSINVWNLEKYCLEAVCVIKNKPINIAFSPIHPIMIIAEETGEINLFYVRPYEKKNMRYKCFAKISIQNICERENSLLSFSF